MTTQLTLRQQVDAVLDRYENEVKKLPLGHENVQRGRSTYNWKMAVIRELRDLAAEMEGEPNA